MNTYDTLLVEANDGICQITINRPQQLNALNRQVIQDLHDVLEEIEQNTDIKAVILTGAGDKAFVAGADIKEFAAFDTEQGKQLAAKGQKMLFNKVEQLSKPVLAAVNGFALGGGLELAMAAHIRVAAEEAKLGLPEVSLGVIPGYGGTQRLAQLVGKGKAMEMIVSAQMVAAQDAHKWGLVNHVVTAAELLATTHKLASKIVRNSPVAIAAAMRAVLANYAHDQNGFDVEIEEFGKSFGTEDFKEGTTAFIEKRRPSFPGK